MSYAIENLKFTIFGHGYDATRNDSGRGMTDPIVHNIYATYGAIDETSTYVWLTDGLNFIKKFKIADWEEVETELPVGAIYHPSNVANNYGVLFSTSSTIIFDLTEGTVVQQIEHSNASHTQRDCILVDDKIYLVNLAIGGNSTITIHTIDIEQGTHTETSLESTLGCNGFVDNDTIFTHWYTAWFWQTTYAQGQGLNGGVQWSISASASGSSGFSGVSIDGALCSDGNIYCPTLHDGAWMMGEYDGNSAPDFNTPTPIRTFGRFDSRPSLHWQYGSYNYVYNQGRTKATFATDIGTFLTDFQSVEILNDNPSDMRPLAMDDRWIISQVGSTQISVLRY